MEIVPLTTSSVTRSLDDEVIITPLWNKAISFSNGEGAYVVVPFNLPLGKIFARKQFEEEVPEDEKFNNTDIRLFIEKKRENEYLYSIIHLTGNYSYVMEENGDVSSLNPNQLESFSGSIRHYSLQGEMINGDIYHKGQIVGKICSIPEPDKEELDSLKNHHDSVQTRGYVTRCEPHLVEYEVCYHTGYPTAEGIVETHVECYTEYRWETYCYDVWVEDGVDNYRCPYCGNPNCSGTCRPTPPDTGGGEGTVVDRSPKELMDKSKFVPYYNGSNCLTLAQQVLKNYGLTNFGSSTDVFRLVYEVNEKLENWGDNPSENYTNAIACIDTHLNSNRPIIVGVDRKIGLGYNEGTTDHFVIITGRGYDSETEQYYYTFMDCATNQATSGCDIDINRFYYDDQSYNLSGETAVKSGLYYTVTQVRPNDGKKYKTTHVSNN